MIISVPEHRVTAFGTRTSEVARTTVLFTWEDWSDIAIATDVKALYLKKGKTAFTPLRKWQQRRRRRKI